jgi:hypothetical protein
MPSPTILAAYNAQGCNEIRIAPTNTQRFYMYDVQNIYVSTNRGANWTVTDFGPINEQANDTTKFLGPKMGVDPNNELICYAGTLANGVYRTSNATHWTQISTSLIPACTTAAPGTNYAQNGGAQIAFDATSSHPGNVTQIIYVNVFGTGVYKTADGGTTWTFLNSSGMPTVLTKIFCGQDGKLYGCTNADTNIYWYDGSWHSASTGAQNVMDVAMNPANSAHIVAVTPSGQLASTTSAQTTMTWSGDSVLQQSNLIATDISWLAAPTGPYMSTSALKFDPSVSNVLYLAAGVGVWSTSHTTVSGTSDNVPWTSYSVGIEQLVTDWGISPPGKNPMFAFFDRAIYTIVDRTKYPSQYGPSYAVQSVQDGFSCDYASSDPNYAVILCIGGTPNPMWVTSNNGGSDGGPSNWTQLANNPPGFNGGCVAMSTPTNILVATAQGAPGGLYYTTNAASAWQSCTITGGVITNTDPGFSNFSFNTKVEQICADRVLANTFCAYNTGTTQPGFYMSIDGGAHFTYRPEAGGHMGASDAFNPQVQSVPGQSGNYYANPCVGIAVGTGNGFFELQWNPATPALAKTTVANVTDVWGFGFGAAKPGGSGYPAVYVYGTISGVRGVFRSDDHCATWTRLSDQFVNGSLDQVCLCMGDMNTYGTCYVGFNGSGLAIFTLDPAAATNVTSFSLIQGRPKRNIRMIGY